MKNVNDQIFAGNVLSYDFSETRKFSGLPRQPETDSRPESHTIRFDLFKVSEKIEDEPEFGFLFHTNAYGGIDHDPSAPVAKAMSAFEATQINFCVKNKEIHPVKGIPAFRARIDALYKNFYSEEYRLVEPSKTLFSEEYFIDLFSHFFYFLPKKDVRKNDYWTEEIKVKIPGEEIVCPVVTSIVDVDASQISIRSEGQFMQTISLLGEKYMDIEGQVARNIVVDKNTGCITDCLDIINCHGDVDLMGSKHTVRWEHIIVFHGRKK